ncbi:MAG TPA: hypothetical protein VIM11_26515 [Tepidisphaeraceae bacterium]|jgi:hypothetical protein
MRLNRWIAFFVVLLVGGNHSHGDTVLIDATHNNGSFEQGGVATVAGWILTGNAFGFPDQFYLNGSDDSIGGIVTFNPGPSLAGGTVSQGFNTVAGGSYNVSFDYGLIGPGGDFQQLQLDIIGLTPASTIGIATSIDSNPFTGIGSIAAFHNYSFSFVATDSGAHTLRFTDLGGNDTGGSDGVLDNVVLTTNAISVPEPNVLLGGLVLFGGFVFTSAFRRRRPTAF